LLLDWKENNKILERNIPKCSRWLWRGIGKLPILCYLIIVWYLFVCMYGTGVWTQDFMLATQAVYHLSHTSSPFCSGYFGEGASQTIQFVQTSLKLWSSRSQTPK
jgi:hypothetical protein